jgi:hypothetical protein
MQQSPRDMLSAAVTKTEHQVFTNAWRKAIPYGTRNISKAEVEDHARVIYANYPGLLRAVGL